MPVRLVPPSRNAAAEYLMKLYAETEQKLIREIARKRVQGYVDYAETAALTRVRRTLQDMVDKSGKYVPLAVEKEFYRDSAKHAAGYANARGMIQNPASTLAIEQLSDNLLGQVQEMAVTSYQSAAFLLGRPEADIFRELGIRNAAQVMALGKGALTATEAFVAQIEAHGITAFVDKAGRRWSLRAYGNMAVRTTVRQAQVSAVLTRDDHDLYKIVRHRAPCEVCAVYADRIYSKSGTNPNYPPLAQAFGKMDVAGPDELSNTFLNIHPNCLVPGGFVLAEGVVSESRRFYNGEVVRLKTSSGNEISVTPNHPILTDRGFVAAGALKEGDKIIETTGEYGAFMGKAPNNINVPSAVDEVFHTLMQARGGASCRMEGSAVQFHGDGIPDSEVDIVFTDCLGRDKINAARDKEVAEKNFPSAKSRGRLFFAFRSFFKIFKRAFASARSIMRGFGFVLIGKRIPKSAHDFFNSKRTNTANFSDFGIGLPLVVKVKDFFKQLAVFIKVFLSNIKLPAFLANAPFFDKTLNSEIVGDANDYAETNAEFISNFFTGEPVIEKRLQDLRRNNVLVVSRLTHKETSLYCGYVYNFETKHNFYSYNNIITHNCLCTLVPWTELGKTPEEIQKARDRSSFEKNPADKEYRGKKEIEEYRQKERNRAELMRELKEWRAMRAAGISGVPGDFATFRRHYGDEAYQQWKDAFKPFKPKPTPKAPTSPVVTTAGAVGTTTAPNPQPVKRPIPGEFVPAKTIDEANAYAAQYVDPNTFGALGVDFKGVSVEVANELNRTIGAFYNEYDVPPFGGIIAPAGNTKHGKLIQSAKAAYSPVRKSFLINRKTMHDLKTANLSVQKERDIVTDFLNNPGNYDTSKASKAVLQVMNNSRVSGRATVPETVPEMIQHELGHALEKPLKGVENYDVIKANMGTYAEKISGYATADFSEYVAESFASYCKGEHLIDPELEKAFLALRRK